MKKKLSPTLERYGKEISNPFVADEIANHIEDAAWHGWNPEIFPHMKATLTDLQELAATSALRMIAENQPDMSDFAGEWLTNELRKGRGHSAAKRLADALKAGTARTSEQSGIVFQAVADFIRYKHAWPNRSDVAPDVAPRTRDAVFQQICDAFCVSIDARGYRD